MQNSQNASWTKTEKTNKMCTCTHATFATAVLSSAPYRSVNCVASPKKKACTILQTLNCAGECLVKQFTARETFTGWMQ